MLAAAPQRIVTATPSIEVISGLAGFEALQPQWNGLLADSSANCLFLTWEWMHTWWRYLSEGRRLMLLAMRTGDNLIGIAPLCVRSPRLSSGHPLPVAEFLGSGHVGSDYLDVIVKKGHEHSAVPIFADFLRSQRLALRCGNLRGDAGIGLLEQSLRETRWSGERTQTNICPYIPLANLTWESYFAGLSSTQRYGYRRKWQRLNREFSIQFERVRSVTECREAIELVFRLHNLRWSRRGTSDAFHTPVLMDFHRDFAPIAMDRGWLRIYVLRLNGRPAACLYGFLYGGKFYFYQSGFDPAYERYSVGLVTMGMAIREAIEDRALEFDLLHGGESYKSHWASERRELYRLELFPPGLVGEISRTSLQIGRNARVMAQRVLRQSQ